MHNLAKYLLENFFLFIFIQGIPLEWKVLSRDCVIYMASVALLVIVMWDGRITSYESTLLMVFFATYFSFLFFSQSLVNWIHRAKCAFKDKGLAQCNGEHRVAIIILLGHKI